MKKKYIGFIIGVCFFLSGCQYATEVNKDKVPISTIESNTELVSDSTSDVVENEKSIISSSDEKASSLVISEQDLQQSIFDRYYASWSDNDLLTAINSKRIYLDNCTFYPQVQDYMEQNREVRDVSNIIEPLYSTDMKYYQEQDFANDPSIIIRLAKNEIYARRGYIFQDNDLKNYFMGQLWYEPSILPDDFDVSIFNEFEKANLTLLVTLE